jgi:hypothetical protein
VSPRPYWRGYLKLSLVSCLIALHAACASSERISFRQINRKTGNRLRQQLVDEETMPALARTMPPGFNHCSDLHRLIRARSSRIPGEVADGKPITVKVRDHLNDIALPLPQPIELLFYCIKAVVGDKTPQVIGYGQRISASSGRRGGRACWSCRNPHPR